MVTVATMPLLLFDDNRGSVSHRDLSSFILDALLHFGKSGPNVGGDVASSKFDAGDRRFAASEAKQGVADAVQILALAVEAKLHGSGEGSEDSVGEEDSKERTNQRRRNRVTDFGGFATDLAHGDDNAKHRRNDSESRHRVADGLDGSSGDACLSVGDLKVDLHHFGEVMGADGAGEDDLHGVAEEADGVVVGQERRVVLDDVALLGLFDVALKAEETFFSGHVEELIHHLQEVHVGLFGAGIGLKKSKDGFDGSRHVLHAVGSEERAGAGTTEDDDFVNLDENAEVSSVHHIAAENGANDNHNAYEYEHESSATGFGGRNPGLVIGNSDPIAQVFQRASFGEFCGDRRAGQDRPTM